MIRWFVAAATVLVGIGLGVGALPVPAGAAAASSGPAAATVTPSSKLTDGQFVAVRATGLPPEHTIQVEQCAGTVAAPPPDNSACDGLTLDTQGGTDAAGNYGNGPGDANGATGYRVYTRPSRLLNSPTTITCDARHPCVLYVGVDQNDFSQEHVFVDIAFAPGVLAPADGPVPPAAGLPPAAAAAVAAAATTTTRPVTVTLIDRASAPAPPAGGSPAALALTGPSPYAAALAGGALLVVVAGSVARRRALRGGTP